MNIRQAPEPTNGAMLRQAFSLFPTGVVVVAGLANQQPVGMAVNSFTSISLDPPLVSISVARTSTTWPKLASNTELGLSVLARHQEGASRSLSRRDVDRFAGLDWVADQHGAVMISGAALWLRCAVHAVLDGGDHEIVLLRVLSSQTFDDVEPLVFHRSTYRELSL